MKASLKLEYSLRVLAQLARRNKGNTVTRIEELAKLEAIPQNYLVQLLNELREGGLVDSRRGKAGAIVWPEMLKIFPSNRYSKWWNPI